MDDRTLLWTISVNIVELHRIDPPCRSQRTISSALTAMERPSLWMKQKHSWRGEKLLLYRRAKVLLDMFDGGEQQNPAPFSLSSEHETKILRLFAKGKLKPNRKSLNISLQTRRNHLHHMNQKLRTHNRLEAVMDGCDFGLPDKRRGETTVVAIGEFEINDRRVTGDPPSQSNIEVRREVPLKPR